MLLDAFMGGGGVIQTNNNDDSDDEHKIDNEHNDADTQQPTLWSDAFQEERGGGDFDDNS